MDANAAVCIKCGCAKGTGTAFCPNCGNPTAPGAAVCLNCGIGLANTQVAGADAKSKLTAGLLGIFLGAYGVHNFYLGYTTKAVIQLVASIVGIILSCIGIGAFIVAGIGIWGVVEGVLILTGKIDKDGKGNPLKS